MKLKTSVQINERDVYSCVCVCLEIFEFAHQTFDFPRVFFSLSFGVVKLFHMHRMELVAATATFFLCSCFGRVLCVYVPCSNVPVELPNNVQCTRKSMFEIEQTKIFYSNTANDSNCIACVNTVPALLCIRNVCARAKCECGGVVFEPKWHNTHVFIEHSMHI